MLKNKLKSTVSIFVLLSWVSISSPGYALEDDDSSDEDRPSSSSSSQRRSRGVIPPSPSSSSSAPSCSSSSLSTSNDSAASSHSFEGSAKRHQPSQSNNTTLEDDFNLRESSSPLSSSSGLSSEKAFLQTETLYPNDFAFYVDAFNQGCLKAAVPLADMCIRKGTKESVAQALSYCEAAYEKGCPEASYWLSAYWSQQLNSSEAAEIKSQKYLEAAAERGHTIALFKRAQYFEALVPHGEDRFTYALRTLTKEERKIKKEDTKGKFKKALDYYQRAIANNSLVNQERLGQRYKKAFFKIGCLLSRIEEDIDIEGDNEYWKLENYVLPFIERAAELGYWKAMVRMAIHWEGMEVYHNVEGGDQKASDYINAVLKIARSFKNGSGLNKNLKKAIKIYLYLAKFTGHEEASFIAAQLYERGYSDLVTQDPTMARQCYKRGLENSRGSFKYAEMCSFKYAEMCEKGLGGERDIQTALEIYKKLAPNNPGVAFNTGWLLDFNPRFSCDPTPFYKTAVRGGNNDAQFMMGLIKREGCYGNTQNAQKAFCLFQKAANQGHLASSLLLAEMLLKSQGNPLDEAQAFNRFKEIYQTARFKETWRRFFRFSESQNEAQAFQLLKARISTGDIENILAITYRSVGKYRQELSLLRLAMEKGNPSAILTLAGIYEKGWRSIDFNPAEALSLYVRAGQRGSPEAMVKVAEAYKNGQSTRRSFSAAFNWFRFAALRAHQAALCKQQQLFHFLIPEALRGVYEGDCFHPIEHDIPSIVSLYHHPDHKQTMMNHWKTLLNSPNHEVMRDISLFILENYKALEISEESDFFLEVVGKRVLSEDITNPKNPFIVWPALLQKRAVSVDVRSLVPEVPLWWAESQHWRF